MKKRHYVAFHSKMLLGASISIEVKTVKAACSQKAERNFFCLHTTVTGRQLVCNSQFSQLSRTKMRKKRLGPLCTL